MLGSRRKLISKWSTLIHAWQMERPKKNIRRPNWRNMLGRKWLVSEIIKTLPDTAAPNTCPKTASSFMLSLLCTSYQQLLFLPASPDLRPTINPCVHAMQHEQLKSRSRS